MTIDAKGMDFQTLNALVRDSADGEITIENCLGQRYIGDGLNEKQIVIHGVAGNGLGAYLDGARITVFGNAQDAMGDTMNAGEIVVHGSAGDAVGYGMRGGRILIREQTPLSQVDFDLIFEKPQLMAFSRSERVRRMGGLPQ